jgi:hypothetical protein
LVEKRVGRSRRRAQERICCRLFDRGSDRIRGSIQERRSVGRALLDRGFDRAFEPHDRVGVRAPVPLHLRSLERPGDVVVVAVDRRRDA